MARVIRKIWRGNFEQRSHLSRDDKSNVMTQKFSGIQLQIYHFQLLYFKRKRFAISENSNYSITLTHCTEINNSMCIMEMFAS